MHDNSLNLRHLFEASRVRWGEHSGGKIHMGEWAWGDPGSRVPSLGQCLCSADDGKKLAKFTFYQEKSGVYMNQISHLIVKHSEHSGFKH